VSTTGEWTSKRSGGQAGKVVLERFRTSATGATICKYNTMRQTKLTDFENELRLESGDARWDQEY
jgi:hypothetical protein